MLWPHRKKQSLCSEPSVTVLDSERPVPPHYQRVPENCLASIDQTRWPDIRQILMDLFLMSFDLSVMNITCKSTCTIMASSSTREYSYVGVLYRLTVLLPSWWHLGFRCNRRINIFYVKSLSFRTLGSRYVN